MSRVQTFNLHGLVGLRIEGTSPETEEVAYWLRELRGDLTGVSPEQVVRWIPNTAGKPGTARSIQASTAEPVQAFVDGGQAGPWACYGRTHNVYAVLQEFLSRVGAIMVHACSIDVGGRGTVIGARGGVGKSTLAFRVVPTLGGRLISDDIVIVSGTGEIMSFPTPMAIYPYHHQLLPVDVRVRLASRRRRSAGLRLVRRMPFGWQIGRQVRRRLLKGGGSLAVSAAQVRPMYLSVHRTDVFPPELLTETAILDTIIVLERLGSEWSRRDITAPEAANRILSIAYHELELAGPLELYSAAGALNLADHYGRAAAVVTEFAGQARRLYGVRVPTEAGPGELSEYVQPLLGNER